MKQVFDFILSIAAACVFLVEEYLWKTTLRGMNYLATYPFVQRIEERVKCFPRWAALIVFTIPFIAVVPTNYAEYIYISHGRIGGAVLMFLLGKIIFTALFARIYMLTRPQIITYWWVAKAEVFVLYLRAKAHAFMNKLLFWRKTRRVCRVYKARIRDVVMKINAQWRAYMSQH